MMNLDKRQKVILGFIVIALVLLAWQIYKLTGGESALSSAPTSATPSNVATPTAGTPKPTVNYAGAAAAVRTNAVETAAMLSNSAATTSDAADSVADPTTKMANDQEKYLELVNEYQMSEIQRMIAEDQASIAQSRFNAAQALEKISQLSGGSANLNDLSGNQDATASSDYELIYTGEDSGQWTATLKKNGQFNDVTAGSVLPDGSKVLTVDDNGVLVQEGSNKELVTFNGVTPFTGDSSTASPQATPASAQSSQRATTDESATTDGSAPVVPTPATASADTTANNADTTNAPAANNADTKISAKPTVVAENKPAVAPSVQAPKQPVASKTVAAANTPVPVKKPSVVPEKVPAVPVPTTTGATAPSTTATSATNNGANAAFMQANKDGYTIQIIADDQINSINNFIAANDLQGKASALKTLRNKKPWYIAVYGEYPSVADADKAIAQMPKVIRSQRPFVRHISDVQAKMVE